jgi:hypothetical protein
MIEGIILAWFLNLFNFYEVSRIGISELFQIDISIQTYYFIFAILGLISSRSTIITNHND